MTEKVKKTEEVKRKRLKERTKPVKVRRESKNQIPVSKKTMQRLLKKTATPR